MYRIKKRPMYQYQPTGNKTTSVSQCSKRKEVTMLCKCGERIKVARSRLGYQVCLDCGDREAKSRKFTIAPINKSNYYYVHNPEMLKQLNPKRTT